MIGLVGSKGHDNCNNEPEEHDLSAEFQFQPSGSLDN